MIATKVTASRWCREICGVVGPASAAPRARELAELALAPWLEKKGPAASKSSGAGFEIGYLPLEYPSGRAVSPGAGYLLLEGAPAAGNAGPLDLEREVGRLVLASTPTIAIDPQRGALYLGRDFAGFAPLYFSLVDGTLLFSTTLDFFRFRPSGIDPDAVAAFLHFLYIPSPLTILRGVSALDPGQIVCFSEQRLALTDATAGTPAPAAVLDGEPERLLDEYQRLLFASVAAACETSPGRTALLLSGGKDSSSLAIAAAGTGSKVTALTLGFDEAVIDEGEDARRVAQYLGIPFRLLKVAPSRYLELFPEYVSLLGQPMGDPAGVPVYAALREVGDEFDSFLDGTGNDGYFGIPSSRQDDLAWLFSRRLPLLRGTPVHHLLKPVAPYTASVLSRAFSRPREEQFVSWNGWSAKEIELLAGRRPRWDHLRLYRFYRESSTPTEFKTRTLCGVWEPESAYRKTVQTAAPFGKTVFFPFLDPDLVRFTRLLPQECRSKDRMNKIILRKLLRRHLPLEIVNKRKGSFNFPKRYVLAGNDFENLDRFLGDQAMARHGLLDPDLVGAAVRRYKGGDPGVEDRLWSLLMLQVWLESHPGVAR